MLGLGAWGMMPVRWHPEDVQQRRGTGKRHTSWNKVTEQGLEPERLRLPGQRNGDRETRGKQSSNDKDAPDYASRSWLVADVCKEEQKVPALQKAHVGLIMELHAGIWAGFFSVFVCGVLFFFSFNLGHHTKINCQKTLLKLQFPLAQESL